MNLMRTLNDAEKLGYLVTGDSNGRLAGAWWERCRQDNRPYVVVRLNRKWASVKMDRPSRTQDLTTDEQEVLTSMLEAAALRAFTAGARGTIYASAGLDYALITKCLVADAGDLAEALLTRREPVR